MSSIKKVFTEVHAFLQENAGKKVSSIMSEVEALMSAKQRGNTPGALRTAIKDANGATVGILDYFYKRWMPMVGPAAVEFGAKTGSSTGFNSMCKQGVNEWTKRQREAKEANTALLSKVVSGEVAPADIPAAQQLIEDTRKAVPETELGFATYEDIVAYLGEQGITVQAEGEAEAEAEAEPAH